VAAVIARITGTALAPGVSRNGRLYTRENIAKAVERAKARIADGKRPISMRTHHAAGDDSTHIVGRMEEVWQDPETGKARYNAAIADTTHGRDIAALTDDSDGQPQFLRGTSIRGAWKDVPRKVTVDGREVETADDLEISGLDYTAEPGVDDADVTHGTAKAAEHDDTPYAIIESAPEAYVTRPAPTGPGAAGTAVAESEVAPEGSGTARTAEAATPPIAKRDSGLTGTGGPYADPGYQADKKQRYQLDTKAHAKAAWGYINQEDKAKPYTANQLKRIKQRIVKALKKFGVEVNNTEHYLIEPVAALTESTTLAECMGYCDVVDPKEAGSFYVTLTNGPVSVSVSSYRVDPADLDLIGRAAMDGACKALATLDPDMDGDIDVPGADSEDTDDDEDEPSANVPGTACPCGCGCAIPVTVTSCPCACAGCPVCGVVLAAVNGESAPQTPAPAAETAPDTEAAPNPTPAPQPAADPTIQETEVPAMSDATTTAVGSTPVPAQAPAPVAPVIQLTPEQFQQLLNRPVAETAAPAAPVAAPAPVAPVAPAPAAVVETTEQMIDRKIKEGVTTGLQAAVASGALKPGRKGLAGRPVGENGNEQVLTELGIPEDWPQKPLHEYTPEERRKYIDTALGEHVLGESFFTGRR
jgi:hypothetical protein